MIRPTITAPDGRTYRGIWPQSLGTTGEAPYIVSLARHVHGVPEVTLPCGRADVATDTDVFEVEPTRSWTAGARQAFSYAGMTGLAPNLALFGPADYLRIYLRIRDRMPGLILWRWGDGIWERVSSRRIAGRRSTATAAEAAEAELDALGGDAA